MMEEREKPELSPEQFRAAQLLVARLLAEAEGRDFEFDEVGLTWHAEDMLPCATFEDGTEIAYSDVLYASMVLLWSMIIERSDFGDEPLTAPIARLGVGVASHEPP